MFRHNCRAIFRPIFEEVDCTTDNVFDFRELLLQELGKITLVCCTEDLRLKFKCGTLCSKVPR